MDWDDLRFFLAVARARGLTGAAAKLRSSQSTIGRRIASLEQSLGAKLFVHHQTGYFLTDEGEALLARAEQVETAVEGLETEAIGRGGGTFGTVRLATAENLATHIVIPALPRFQAEHPGIALEIATGIGSIGLSHREADLALRLARPSHGNLTIRKLGAQAYALYGAKAYVEAAARSAPKEGGRFAGHRFILWDETLAYLPMAQWLTRVNEGGQPGLTTTSLQTQLAAVRAGLGLGVLPCFLADPEADLVRMLSPDEVLSQDIWLVMHPDLSGTARVQAVAQFLIRLIAEVRPRLEGRLI